MISKSPTISKEDTRKSATQNTSVGSGSRPTASKMQIDTSAPSQPRELGRAPSGWLK